MEKYSYNSYPDSADSSPRSREMEFETNPPAPWDDQKAKFMCSYGGKIQPRPHDNQLSYVGGETKILSVDRSIRLSAFVSKLSALTGGGDSGDLSFKYQLPGEDLDALISVTNDDDLDHMMHEYDRIQRGSAKPQRMRLFLFPGVSASLGSDSVRSDRDRFVAALNSGPVRLDSEKTAVPVAQGNVDFFFGLEKRMAAGVPPPPPPQVNHSAPPPHATAVGGDERVFMSDPVDMQRQLQDMQRLQIRDIHHEQHHHHLGAGGYYAPPKAPENNRLPETLHNATSAAPPGYWPENNFSGGVFKATPPGLPEQTVYVIPGPAPGAVYHAPPPSAVRPAAGQATQGYYTSGQRMGPEVYREQTVYNNMVQSQPPQPSPPPPVTSMEVPPPFSAAPPPFSAGPPPIRPVADSAYGQMAYYNAQGGGVVVPPPMQPQYQGAGAAVSGGGGGGRLGPEGKVVSKATQAV